ncbi:hypothetical protein M378DRAFT_156667 [Amanita muscaria Koide BX008]|uniref:Uncharacterized protein n=1 Tax=Amanita muscaria (strain Koide BX008) TaxID=946122 RepID=A0A0C2XLY2_AMAMK|nr:hypothetical protein M378DRAFT_156667 [Amanita muscaria Koide BX008]
MSDHSIKFGNGADFSKASALAFGANSKATHNSNNKTTNNKTNNRGKNSYNTQVGTQYGNTNTGDGQQNGGGTYNFSGKH